MTEEPGERKTPAFWPANHRLAKPNGAFNIVWSSMNRTARRGRTYIQSPQGGVIRLLATLMIIYGYPAETGLTIEPW
jgi:hypothetical protein